METIPCPGDSALGYWSLVPEILLEGPVNSGAKCYSNDPRQTDSGIRGLRVPSASSKKRKSVYTNRRVLTSIFLPIGTLTDSMSG